MKKIYPALRYFNLQSKIFKTVFLFLLILNLANDNEVCSQMCSAPPISPSSYISVDPPTFRWYVVIAGSCGPVLIGSSTECPINSNFPPPAFGSFPLSDTCYLMSNSQWNSVFGLNTQYCWGTHVINGGFIWQTGGYVLRLPAVLPQVSLLFPSNADTQISVTPRINWINIDSANNYTLRVYSDACCISTVFDTTLALNAVTVPFGRLSGNSRYYYRVKSYRVSGEGPFSDPYYFNTWQGQIPNLLTPANNSEGTSLTPVLDWDDIAGPLEHRVQVSTNISFSSLILDISGLSVSNFIIPAGVLTNNTIYYWRTASRTSSGWTPFSKGWMFKTYSIPDPVVLTYPVNNSIELPTTLTFKWKKAGETLSKVNPVTGLKGKFSKLDLIDKYWFELVTDTVTMAGLISDNNITDTSKFISGLSKAKTYYWHVKANNDLGWGPFSGWWKFTTVIGPPQAPLLAFPPNNSFPQFLNLQFRWNRSIEFSAKGIGENNSDLILNKPVYKFSDAVSLYCFELTEDTVSLNGILRDSTLIDTVKTLNLSVNSKTYYWRVKAKNEFGWGVYSNWWKFITIPAEYGWALAASNINVNISGISFVDVSNGWLCQNSNGYVYKTSDGGSNWSVIFQDYGLTAQSICFTDLNNGQIASRGGGSWNYPWWSTMNGGTYWMPMLYMNYQSSNFVSVASTPEGIWQVGTLTTQGSYITYPAIISAGTEHLLSHNIGLNRVRGGKNNAWIVGNQGLIYRSLTQLYVGEDINLNGISFNDVNTGYIVGGSNLYKSTNNGTNWFKLFPLIGASYNDVYFANKDTGWVACSLSGEGVILGTTNGGSSWGLQYKGPYAGSEFNFVENKYGWLLCGNSILRTTNVSGAQLVPPVLLQPVNGAIAQSLTPLLDWEDSQNALLYRIQLSTDSLFEGLLIDDSSLSVSNYDVQPGLLQYYTEYYWRVSVKKYSSWTNFSGKFRFRTFGVPVSVVLNYPSNNSTGIPTALTFSWFSAISSKKLTPSESAERNSYDLFINNRKFITGNYWFELTSDTVSLTNLITDSLLTDTLKSISGLSYSNSYFWRVKGKNEAGWGAFSNWAKFTSTSGAPVLQYPGNNQAEVLVTPLLNWIDVPDALKYRVQVSAFSNFSTLWIDDSTAVISQLQVNPGVLAYNSLYYWRVKTRNAAGWGEYQTSPFRFFTQVNPPPPVPVLAAPLNNATGVSATPLIDWNDATGAVKYRLQVSAVSDFSTMLINDSSITVSNY